MIFSELYSAYYTTVARILKQCVQGPITEKDLRETVRKCAFSESVLTIPEALTTGQWPLLRKDGSSVIRHEPTMPLTTLEKEWLKAILQDPRIRLFQPEVSGLEDVEPLFRQEDISYYDRYGDGDPYEDEGYIQRFQLVREAIREHKPLQVLLKNRFGRSVRVRFYPTGLEYSGKDDKFRILSTGSRFAQYRLGRIFSCEMYQGPLSLTQQPPEPVIQTVTFMLKDERNALERTMLHFAHFEKSVEKLEDGRFQVRLNYDEADETELVIRILSFGPLVQVTQPQTFADLIRERLKAQMALGPR